MTATTRGRVRGELTDAEWARLEPLLPPERRAGKQGRGRPCKRDNRTIINGILWVLRTGSPWRDLPEHRYGPWNTVYTRFWRWSRAGVFERALQALQGEALAAGKLDMSVAAMDGTYIKAHPHAAGARKKGSRLIKRSSAKVSDAVGAGSPASST